jgi:hypothetical protein
MPIFAIFKIPLLLDFVFCVPLEFKIEKEEAYSVEAFPVPDYDIIF